jgi:hypothetical protein
LALDSKCCSAEEIDHRSFLQRPYNHSRTSEPLLCSKTAERLFFSRKTIEHHVTSILTKTGAGNRTEAVRLAATQIAQAPEAASTTLA